MADTTEKPLGSFPAAGGAGGYARAHWPQDASARRSPEAGEAVQPLPVPSLSISSAVRCVTAAAASPYR